jgi:hypothetical protein
MRQLTKLVDYYDKAFALERQNVPPEARPSLEARRDVEKRHRKMFADLRQQIAATHEQWVADGAKLRAFDYPPERAAIRDQIRRKAETLATTERRRFTALMEDDATFAGAVLEAAGSAATVLFGLDTDTQTRLFERHQRARYPDQLQLRDQEANAFENIAQLSRTIIAQLDNELAAIGKPVEVKPIPAELPPSSFRLFGQAAG